MRLGVGAALVDGALLAGDVEVADGRIAAVGLAPGGSGIAAPGFVDLQANGFMGVDFIRADGAGYARAAAAMLGTGTTACQPTFITAPEDELLAALAALPRGAVAGLEVIGAHVEGPFLSPARMGVHPPAHRRDPDPALLERILAAGPVRQLTLAPELPGAGVLVDRLVAAGVTVSAGHTDATAAEAHAGFDRGIATVTHLFNAMRPPASRDPGVVFAALARRDVRIQLIADGHHVAREAMQVAWAAARGRLALVTDAVAATGMGDGTFALAGATVRSAGGVIRGPEGQLAGSTLTMDAAVRRLHALGAPLAEALAAASAVPAAIARRSDLGVLAPGARADVVVLDDRLEVARVLTAGVERHAG